MNKSEIVTELRKAKKCRDRFDDEAISILHQITNKYPQDNYFYLLASTYLEAGSIDTALEYADKTLKINDKNKEAYELKGIIFEEQKKIEEAEKMYLKALDIDFYEPRNRLVELYLEQKRYDDVIRQCEFVLSYKEFDFSTQKKLIESTAWEAFVLRLSMAYIKTEQYNDAIRSILKYKELETQAGVFDKYGLFDSDVDLYKLYLLTNNVEGITGYRDLLLNHYEISEDDLKIIEKEASKKKI